MGVPLSTLSKNITKFAKAENLNAPTKEETIAKIRAFAGPNLDKMSNYEKMHTIFMLRGVEGLTDALLCEAVGVRQSTFATYHKNADSMGVSKRAREDAEIAEAINGLLRTASLEDLDPISILHLLRDRCGIRTSKKRICRILGC